MKVQRAPLRVYRKARMFNKKVRNSNYQLVERNEKCTVGAGNCSSVSWLVIFACSVLSLFLVYINSSVFSYTDCVNIDSSVDNEGISVPANVTVDHQDAQKADACAGKYIYVLDLPSQFNSDILENCSILSPWFDMCKLLKNSGLGPRLNDTQDNVFSGSGWFSTDQFSLEVIFHNRMKQYRCLTSDYSKAGAVFVPYYAGLDVGRYLWKLDANLRDATSLKFAEYIKQRPEWKAMGGRDHFLIVGRITWDFRRTTENTSDSSGWGNRLFHIPEVKNMTSLLIESFPYSNSEIAIPYPTYFHPSSDIEVERWQERMKRKRRPYLFSFAGAPRPHLQESIRNDIIKQCLASKDRHCKFVNCNPSVTDCSKPQTVMKLFQRSVFCLQPPGDSYTRKSIFDTILAGCIPVLLHPDSAYVQYLWHLPKNYSSYSVFIPMDDVKSGNVSIEERLLQIPKEQVIAMREEVIRLIPKIVYANPTSNLESFHQEDAFDVTVTEVLNRVEKIRMEIKEGKNSTFDSFPEILTWKYNFFGDLENHEWDKYFDDTFGIQ